jgi:hypothetical protein
MSFRAKLSNFFNNVQYLLFPQLEKDLGKLSDDHKKLVSVLELVRIEEFISCTRFYNGRPRKDRCAIARAFIAKIIFKITYTKQLRERLEVDVQLKKICGFDSLAEIPSESKFSRTFFEFSQTALPDRVHKELIKEIYKDQIVGHVTKDSTPIEVREKSLNKGCSKARKKASKAKRRAEMSGKQLSRRKKQLQANNLDEMLKELPIHCDKGMKTNAQGSSMVWKGFKLHAAVDDHCIPLAVIVTSASLNDCEAAIPLARKSHSSVANFYDLMDSAYDHPEIVAHSISLGHIPIIDKCPHNTIQKQEKENEKNRKKLIKLKTAEDVRYSERFPKERFNALFKDYYGGRAIFYKGHAKVSCHVMFGVLALAATLIIKLIE